MTIGNFKLGKVKSKHDMIKYALREYVFLEAHASLHLGLSVRLSACLSACLSVPVSL